MYPADTANSITLDCDFLLAPAARNILKKKNRTDDQLTRSNGQSAFYQDPFYSSHNRNRGSD